MSVAGGLAPPDVEEEEQEARSATQGIIFVLESAQLEVAQVGKVREAAVAKAPLSRCVRASAPDRNVAWLCCPTRRATSSSTATTTRLTLRSTRRTPRSTGPTSATRCAGGARPQGWERRAPPVRFGSAF